MITCELLDTSKSNIIGNVVKKIYQFFGDIQSKYEDFMARRRMDYTYSYVILYFWPYIISMYNMMVFVCV